MCRDLHGRPVEWPSGGLRKSFHDLHLESFRHFVPLKFPHNFLPVPPRTVELKPYRNKGQNLPSWYVFQEETVQYKIVIHTQSNTTHRTLTNGSLSSLRPHPIMVLEIQLTITLSWIIHVTWQTPSDEDSLNTTAWHVCVQYLTNLFLVSVHVNVKGVEDKLCFSRIWEVKKVKTSPIRTGLGVFSV